MSFHVCDLDVNIINEANHFNRKQFTPLSDSKLAEKNRLISNNPKISLDF